MWVDTGTNASSNVYRRRTGEAWANSGDTATLRSSAGTIVDTCSFAGGGVLVAC